MTETTQTMRVQLTFPTNRVTEPIIYHLVEDFGLIPNIRRANMDSKTGGFLFLEITGSADSLESGMNWLNGLGIITEPIGAEGLAWTV